MPYPTMVHLPYLVTLILASKCLGTVDARLNHNEAFSDSSPLSVAAAAVAKDEQEELPVDDPMQTGVSLIAMQFTQDPLGHRDPMDMIRNGELGLAAIRYSPTSFVADANGDSVLGSYTNIHGEFCAFDLASNKRNPPRYPTAHHIMSESEHCGEHAYSLPLRDVVEALRDHDHDHDAYAPGSGSGMKSLPVSGLLFHEGYSGAGLVSNVLSTFDSALVVSEHPALHDALNACDTIRNRYKIEDCSTAMQMNLVQDVISLLSRTPSDSPVERLYLKLTSASAAYLPELRSLYPDAKWTFVYRNAEHALAKATNGKRIKTCAKARRNPTSALSAKSVRINQDLEKLSHHEVCAMHLSTLTDAAFNEHKSSKTGMLISYDEDLMATGGIQFFLNNILPYLGLQEEINSNPELVRNGITHILSMRSNASGKQSQGDKKWWNGETVEVSEAVGMASRAYMEESMDSIRRIR